MDWGVLAGYWPFVVGLMVTGVVSGIAAGLLGIGGGAVIVPALSNALLLMGYDAEVVQHVAVGTSLAIIIPTGIMSARAHHRRGALDIDVLKLWAPFIVLGTFVGGLMAGLYSGDVLRIHPAEGGEEILALDGKTYHLQAGMMAISDAAGVESIAGIMGGEHSGCTGETTDLFLESAYWDPITIATTGRALRINSDARYRFERGVDPAFTGPGLELATQMILDLCGGEAGAVVSDGAVPDTTRTYRFDAARVGKLVGMDIPEAEQRATLEALGFTLKGDRATPPSWRPDVLGEADLVEEVARVASLSKLEGKPMARVSAGVPAPILTPMQRRERLARRTLAALGYHECVTYSFIDAASATLFGGGGDALRLENPISSEMTHMRPDLLPGLLQAAARNQARGAMDMALFELGPVFSGGEPGDQSLHATGLLVGASAPRDPHGSRRTVDLFDARADAESVLAALGAPAKLQIDRKVADWFHPGRAGRLTLGPKLALATFGEVHPRILRAYGIKGAAMAFTLDLAAVPQPAVQPATKSAADSTLDEEMSRLLSDLAGKR